MHPVCRWVIERAPVSGPVSGLPRLRVPPKLRAGTRLPLLAALAAAGCCRKPASRATNKFDLPPAECEFGYERNGTTCAKMPDISSSTCPASGLLARLRSPAVPAAVLWVVGSLPLLAAG